MHCKLSELEIDDIGIITKVEGRGEITRRILDMGLIVGTKVRLERVAPLGDPIDIWTRGFYLSLRKAEAERIEVEKMGKCCGRGKRHHGRC